MLPKMGAEKFVMLAVTAIICTMILYPIGVLIYKSFTISEWGKPVVYTLSNYAKIFTTDRYLLAIWNSLIVSLGTTAFAGALGIVLAWITARTNTPLRVKLEPLNIIPFFLSPLVGAICWSYILSPKVGLLNVYLMRIFNLSEAPFNIYGLGGIIWVMGLFWAPYVYLFTIGLFQKMDPALEEAAKTCGASQFQVIRNITFPLALPGILYASIIVFIIGIGVFSVPAMLITPIGKSVLGTEIWEIVSSYPGNYNLASAVCMITFVMCITLVMVQRKILLKREYTMVTGKGYRPGLIDLGRWKYAALAFNLSYLLIAVIAPLGILVLVSLHRLWTGAPDFHNLTLSNFTFLLTKYNITMTAIWNSLILGFFGATAAMSACVVLVFILVRTKMKGRSILDVITSLPLGIPGIVFAMGLLAAYIKTPLYGTLWVLGLAYITVFLPTGMRSTNAIFLAVSPELEESSRTCGASWFATIKNISIPLMKSGLIGGWLILFLVFVKEINTSILLFTPGNEVMSIVLFQLTAEHTSPTVAAYGVILTGILLAAVWCIRKVIGLEQVS